MFYAGEKVGPFKLYNGPVDLCNIIDDDSDSAQLKGLIQDLENVRDTGILIDTINETSLTTVQRETLLSLLMRNLSREECHKFLSGLQIKLSETQINLLISTYAYDFTIYAAKEVEN